MLPAKRTTLLYSATITASIEALQGMAMRNCFQFEAQKITTVATVKERYCHVPAMVRDAPSDQAGNGASHMLHLVHFGGLVGGSGLGERQLGPNPRRSTLDPKF